VNALQVGNSIALWLAWAILILCVLKSVLRSGDLIAAAVPSPPWAGEGCFS